MGLPLVDGAARGGLEAIYNDRGNEDDNTVAGAIPWPRRPGLAGLALLGITIATPAVIAILWVGVDAVLNGAGSFAGVDWWRDRLSLGVAGAAIGFPTWLAPWAALQRAAAVAPRERAARARRLLVGAVTLMSVLIALGFAIALLWPALRAALGETLDAGATVDAVKDGSVVFVLAILGLSQGILLRHDLRLEGGGAPKASVPIFALLMPGAEESLARLRATTSLRIDVAGYLSLDGPATSLSAASPLVDARALPAALCDAAARSTGSRDRVLLILGAGSGLVYPYAQSAIQILEPVDPVLATSDERAAPRSGTRRKRQGEQGRR